MALESDSIAGLDRALRADHGLANSLRWLMIVVLGACAALFLAWFMDYLIQSSDMMLSDSKRVRMLDFVRLKRNESAERKDRTPERPKIQETPDVPPLPQSQADASGQQLQVSAMPTETSVDISRAGAGFGSGEGEYLPIVKVAPIYPRRAVSRGIEGQCLVMYTVTAAGTVRDVKVIEEECDSAVFHRASVEAALRFKYKPRVIDGEAVEVHGVPNVFTYEIDGVD
jgi:protein TonB